MPVPQRMTAVTLGARTVARLRVFYRAIGWEENDGSDDAYASFSMRSVRLAVYPIDSLAREAAGEAPVIAAGTWNGVTLTVNVAFAEPERHRWEIARAPWLTSFT